MKQFFPALVFSLLVFTSAAFAEGILSLGTFYTLDDASIRPLPDGTARASVNIINTKDRPDVLVRIEADNDESYRPWAQKITPVKDSVLSVPAHGSRRVRFDISGLSHELKPGHKMRVLLYFKNAGAFTKDFPVEYP